MAAARAIGVTPRTIFEWERDDEEFQALVRGTGIFQSGPLRADAAPPEPEDTESDMSLLWIASGATPPEVIGSLSVKTATFCRVFFVHEDDVETARAEIVEHRLPSLPTARTATLKQSALSTLQDADELQTVCTLFCAPIRESFQAFCALWHFRAGETKDIRTLAEPWEGQQILADTLTTHDHVYALKGRKIGETTMAVAFAGYVARVRDENAVIHSFSYRERAANDLTAQIRFGLDNLPPFLRLPLLRETRQEVAYDAGGNDVRVIASFPTSTSTAVERSASHSLLDELADWPHLEETLASLEPTYSAPGASSTILSTGGGPTNYATTYYRACEDSSGLHFPIFVPANARPGRDEAWLEAKRRQTTKQLFKVEYAMSVADALEGSGDKLFSVSGVEESDGGSMLAVQPGRKYYCSRHSAAWRTTEMHARCPKCGAHVQPVPFLLSWDIGGAGERSDASVGTVLDLADSEMLPIAEQRRFTGLPFAQLQREIEKLAFSYFPAKTVVEMSGLGQSVAGNLELPPHRVIPFWTTERSKAKIIGDLQLALEQGHLKFSHAANPQLRIELLGYQVPDTYVVQDCIMSLAVGLGKAGEAFVRPGRVLSVLSVDAYGR